MNSGPTEPSQQDPAASEPSNPVVAAQAIRFCRACGASWNADWLECEVCSARRRVNTAPASLREEQGQIRSALWLYFSLLSVSIVMILVVIAQARPATVMEEFVVEAAMSAIVLAWCIVSWRRVLPFLRRLPHPGYVALAFA